MEHMVIIESELEEDTGPWEELLSRVIPAALEAEGVAVPCEVDVLLTDDAGIRQINLEQRQVDRPTDPGTGLVPLGDMVLSLERAEAQGAEYGHGAEREVAYLAVHSVLHLLGYDHMDEGPEKARMREREEAILNRLGITREG